ncbi:nucleotide exchange factor GrpE [Paremcibacter congregatus]|uniref:nucleotide exchange factor GrpE n=1 Tax=Paremcibacter congregatus TaxID=2043170 RepID=UPI003A8CCEFB
MTEHSEKNDKPTENADVTSDNDAPTTEASEAAETAETAAPANDVDALATAQAEISDLKDKLLRAVAETENIRRRSEREKTDAANYAITAFARDLLGVGDNLRRALDSIPEEADLGENAKNLVEGIEMTERELLNMLERHKIKKIDPKGEKFSHDLHQALFEVPDTGEEDGTIVQVMQVGYVIKDRLLRPAMVGVAKGGNKKEPMEHVDTKV